MSQQIFYAGDGDDVITMGDQYQTNRGFGGRGDDTIYLPTIFTVTPTDQVDVYGGLGDDQILPKDPLVECEGCEKLRIYGNEGNDKL